MNQSQEEKNKYSQVFRETHGLSFFLLWIFNKNVVKKSR